MPERGVADLIIKWIGTEKFYAFAYRPFASDNHLSFFVPIRRQYISIVLAPDGLYRIEIDVFVLGKRISKRPILNVKPQDLSQRFSEIVDPE